MAAYARLAPRIPASVAWLHVWLLLQGQAQQVLDVAYAMVGLANGGLGTLSALQEIVNDDVDFPLFLSYFGVSTSTLKQAGSVALHDMSLLQ